ncbi:hypothetical protein GBAR_LOCUS22330, partial [Geodia barretti]
MRAAGKQFQLFKSKTQTHRPTNPDSEVESVAGRLGPAIQVGEEREGRREKGASEEWRQGRPVLWEEEGQEE